MPLPQLRYKDLLPTINNGARSSLDVAKRFLSANKKELEDLRKKVMEDPALREQISQNQDLSLEELQNQLGAEFDKLVDQSKLYVNTKGAQEDFKSEIEKGSALPKEEKEGTKFTENPLKWGWEKIKSVLKTAARNPLKTATVALIAAWFAAPYAIPYFASKEFAAAWPTAARVDQYLRSFLPFATGGTGVKPDTILRPLPGSV